MRTKPHHAARPFVTAVVVSCALACSANDAGSGVGESASGYDACPGTLPADQCDDIPLDLEGYRCMRHRVRMVFWDGEQCSTFYVEGSCKEVTDAQDACASLTQCPDG